MIPSTLKYKVDGERLKLSGWVVKYRGRKMTGLTGKDGLLMKRFYPTFNRDRATKVTTTKHGRGIPLSTPLKALSQRQGKPTATAGMARGNKLTKHVAQMLTFIRDHKIPLHLFGMQHRQNRVPKRAGKKLVNPYLSDEQQKKDLMSLLNSTAPHLPLLVTKLIELGIEPDGYEVPVIDAVKDHGTRLDLTGIRIATGKRINMELKTGGDSYIDDYQGMLRAPLQSFRSNTLNHWLLQTAYSQQWFNKTYQGDSEALLIRVSRRGCFHYFLPKGWDQEMPLL